MLYKGSASGPINSFPGLEPKPDSVFTKSVAAAYPGVSSPRLYTVHAGLECGALLSRLETVTDCVSIGPTILGAHSPGERLDIQSAKRFILWVEKIVLST